MFIHNASPKCTLSPQDTKRWPELVNEHTEPNLIIRTNDIAKISNPFNRSHQQLEIFLSSDRGNLLPLEPLYTDYLESLPNSEEEEEELEDEEKLEEWPIEEKLFMLPGDEGCIIFEDNADIDELFESLTAHESLVKPEDYKLVGIDFRKDTFSLVYHATAKLPDATTISLWRYSFVPYTAFFDPLLPDNTLEFYINIYEGVDPNDSTTVEDYIVTIGLEEGNGIAYVEFEGAQIKPDEEDSKTNFEPLTSEGSFEFEVELSTDEC